MIEPIHCLTIVGSTGTGKTALALYIAQYIKSKGYTSAIINMDSRQVYKEIPIISAQPTEEDKCITPHYLYGYLQLTDRISVEQHIRSVYALCESLWNHGTIPLLVGGTGLYFHVLLHGISPIPDIDITIRQAQHSKVTQDKSKAYEELCDIDPIFAYTISAGDSQRITRGLEVFYGTGIPLSQWHTQKQTFITQHTSIGITKPIPLLHIHLQQRIDSMIAMGAIDEIHTAYLQSQKMITQAHSCIGFSELMKYIQGSISYHTCVEQWFLHTRQYAKRQRTWFRNKHHIDYWLEYQYDINIVHDIIDRYLNTI